MLAIIGVLAMLPRMVATAAPCSGNGCFAAQETAAQLILQGRAKPRFDPEALKLFQQADRLATAANDFAVAAEAKFLVVWALNDLRRYQDALPLADRALAYAIEHQVEAWRLWIIKERLWSLSGLGKLADKVREIDALIAECKTSKFSAPTYDALRLAVNAMYALRNQAGVVDTLRNLMNWTRAHGTAVDFKYASSQFCVEATILGLYDEGLAAGLECLEVSKDLPWDSQKLDALEEVATAYGMLGQLDQAEIYMTELLKRGKQLVNVPAMGSAYVGLGFVYTFQKRHSETLKLMKEALALATLANDQTYICLTNVVLGYTEFELGHFEEALKHGDAAFAAGLKTSKDGSKGYFSSLGEGVRAIALARLGRSAEAVKAADSAIEFGTGKAMAQIDPIRRAMFKAVQGVAYESNGDLRRYEELFGEVVDLLEGAADQVQDPSQLGSLQQRIPNPYGYYADAKFKNLGAMDALLARERGRARGLARQIALTGDGDYSRYFKPEEAKQLKELLLKASIANARVRAADAKSPPDPAERAKAQDELTQTEAEIENLKVKIYTRNPRLKELHAAAQAPPTRARLERLSRDHPDTAFIEWALIDRRHTLVMVLVGGKATALDLPVGEYMIDALASDWHRAIAREGGRAGNGGVEPGSGPDAPEDQFAKQAYTLLLEPLEPLLTQSKVTRLAFVADGNLADLPFAAMLDGKGKRLIERFAISQAVSLGVLTWPDNPQESTKEFFCVADTTSGDGLVAKASPQRAGLGPLAFARKEGIAVCKLFPGVQPLVGPDATEERVRAEMGSFRILHFACHGQLEARNSLRNGLVLASEPQGSVYDGILQSREIVGMKLAAELTVLSACDTGRGTAKGGDGLQSLAWAFRGANCPAVIASHWQVDDEATGLMMTTLYSNLAKGVPKDKALQAAALKVMAKHKEPYYWAAFDLIGDYRPILKRAN